MARLEHSGAEAPDGEIYKIRHGLAHVLAQAVLQMRPGSTLGFGPPIKDGFYYDFILNEPLTEEDFPEIERRMKRILKKRQRFYREELDAAEALQRIEWMGEPYKREYGAELIEKHGLNSLSFYRNGPFLDMCEGPHVENTGKIPRDAFKLRSLAGAYWRGDSDNVMMTRIYAWAFADRQELDAHLARWQEAQARDHKKIGRALGIFAIDGDSGRGVPLWLPSGTVVRDELERLAKELEFHAGYQRVATPHLARESLYRKTGHLPYYADDMYPPMAVPEAGDEQSGAREAYRLRPMNCPHHHKVYAAEPRSYRDLPLRLAEYGQVYRWEESGAVAGLVRVRGMCMNDAHIYCTPQQTKAECKAVMALYQQAYAILGLQDYVVRLSRWNPEDPKGKQKYVDNAEAWSRSEAMLREVLEELSIDYVEGPGEAAFYGPKIDIQLQTVTGREETISTVQLDFAQPAALGLRYVGADGAEHMPYCIHRAPLSTHERMVAFLLEHYAGAFPTWLAPVQVQVVAVSEKFDGYGREVVERLRRHMVRAELAPSSDTVSKKIRQGTLMKIPNLLIVGGREQTNRTVTLRRYGHRKQHMLELEQFEAVLLAAIRNRSMQLEVPS